MSSTTTEGLLSLIDDKDKIIERLKGYLQTAFENHTNGKSGTEIDFFWNTLKTNKDIGLTDIVIPTSEKDEKEIIIDVANNDFGMLLDAEEEKISAHWVRANLTTGVVTQFVEENKQFQRTPNGNSLTQQDVLYKAPLRFIKISDPEYVKHMKQPHRTNGPKVTNH